MHWSFVFLALTHRYVFTKLKEILWKLLQMCRADSRFAPHQWETALLCNDVSHWLGAGLESALDVLCSSLMNGHTESQTVTIPSLPSISINKDYYFLQCYSKVKSYWVTTLLRLNELIRYMQTLVRYIDDILWGGRIYRQIQVYLQCVNFSKKISHWTPHISFVSLISDLGFVIVIVELLVIPR